MPHRILVALKFTPAGKQALLKAIELAQELGAELFVFHALDYALQERNPADPRIVKQAQGAEQKLAQFIDSLATPAPRIAFTCRPADPALGACREAKDIGAHMIVMGAHRDRTKVSLGRVDYIGQTIMEKAPCSIMLVPHPVR